MWTAASDLGKYLATLTIIFEIFAYEAIWQPWLDHGIAWEIYSSKLFQWMSRIFKLV